MENKSYIKNYLLCFLAGIVLVVALNSFSLVFMFHTTDNGFAAGVYDNTIEAMKVAHAKMRG